ncbi:MAG: PEP-CTERM sorting domain-containing protein [Verrucomicrobiae bacterium]|nr:PEP-CTERM sorting domain-containing protein [Verrucomicrobiae bacterium]
MRTYESQWARCASLLFGLAVVSPAFGQGTLIGPSIRNGSFEDGVITPWSGNNLTAAQDSSFASHGSWYAVVSSLVSTAQNLTPDPTDGLTFLLTFDARMGVPGFDSVSTRMDARTPEGASLSASITPIAVPPLSASAWQSYQYQLEMPGAWDSAGIFFSIAFSKSQPLGGVTHFAYLDNVVLQQIPEPSSLALVLCGGALWLTARERRRNGGTVKRPVP